MDSSTSSRRARACSGVPNISCQNRDRVKEHGVGHLNRVSKRIILGWIIDVTRYSRMCASTGPYCVYVCLCVLGVQRTCMKCACTCVKAKWSTVSEARLCKLCWRERVSACRRRGRAVAKPQESQCSSAVASRTLQKHKHPTWTILHANYRILKGGVGNAEWHCIC